MKERKWKFQTQNIPLAYLEVLQPYFISLRRRVQKQGIPTLTLDREKLDFKQAAGKAEVVAKVTALLKL